MRITKHKKKRSERVYWFMRPDSTSEAERLVEAGEDHDELLGEKFPRPDEPHVGYFTYNEKLMTLITQRFTVRECMGSDTQEDNTMITWHEFVNQGMHKTEGASVLRKYAALKARDEHPGRSRTEISKGWKAQHCKQYLEDNIWYDTASGADLYLDAAPEHTPDPVEDGDFVEIDDIPRFEDIPDKIEYSEAPQEDEDLFADAEAEREAPAPSPAPAAKATTPANGDFGAMFAAMLEPYLSMTVKEEDVIRIVRENITGQPQRIEIKLPDLEAKDVGTQHHSWSKLLSRTAAGINTMMVGPPGTGKTHAAHAVADAMELPFYTTSVGAQTTKSDLLGFIDAQSRVVRTQLREAYENGGIFLLDEIDAGNPNVLTVLNAALANGICPFPDKQVAKHEDFHCIAAANTYGRGGDRLFVGRNQLDAASLDRFVNLDWEVDEELELHLSHDEDWVRHVQKLRKAADSIRAQVVISPRASIYGSILIKCGESWEDVESDVIWKGVAEELRNQIKRAA